MDTDSDFLAGRTGQTIRFTAALSRMPPGRRAQYMAAHGFGFLNAGAASRQAFPEGGREAPRAQGRVGESDEGRRD